MASETDAGTDRLVLRSVRVSDADWIAASEAAAARGESVSDVIRDALRRYARRHAPKA